MLSSKALELLKMSKKYKLGNEKQKKYHDNFDRHGQ